MRLRFRLERGASRLSDLARRRAVAAVLRVSQRHGAPAPDGTADGATGREATGREAAAGGREPGRLPATSGLRPVLARWAGEDEPG